MKTTTVLAALTVCALVATAQAAPAAMPPELSGEVMEVLPVDGYTYLRLKTASGELWAAVPTAAVNKGAQVTIGRPMVMENFQSKTLKKTFDRIVFGQLAGPGVKAAAPHGMPPAAAPATPAAAVATMAKVPKAGGRDAKTVAEVVGGKAALAGKAVVVRGQVVKFNRGIMGRNWVHLRDGSGSAADGSNDLLVTTQDAAAVGDIVDARGTVRTDVDLGSGYRYAVLVEGAALSK